ncbi:MAG: amino acid adenylation domain-containing protein, partial [Bacteroidota bacterium]
LDLDRLEVRNLYGPSEDTTFSTCHLLKPQVPVSIGRPIANTQIYILDPQLRPVPIGVTGELCISGAGLSQGYFNRPELNSQKFIDHPFRPAQKMYKTGDLARWRPDGTIDLRGRTDHQVKIRGYRIELGEIEHALEKVPGVIEAVVTVVEDTGGAWGLSAHLLGEANLVLDKVKTQIQEQLPSFLIPNWWNLLDAFPRTPNGKVDRKALSLSKLSAPAQQTYLAPQNPTQEQLVDIWHQLLDYPKISIHDSFFEMGGHSLLAIRLAALIEQVFQIEVPIATLFEYPTIAQLANWIKEQAKQGIPRIQRISSTQPIPLSFAQERLWLVHQLHGSLQYHLTSAIHLKGPVKPQALDQAFRSVIERHQILRTVIQSDGEAAFQVVLPSTDWQMTIVPQVPESQSLLDYCNQVIDQPFDLSQEYPLRIQLIHLTDEAYLLLVVLHHIASDGWSTSILIDEFQQFYESYEQGQTLQLPPLPIQYRDFAVWQRQHYQHTDIQQQLAYWQQQLTGVRPLELPTDYLRPPVQGINGASCKIQLSPTLSKQLNRLGQEQSASDFMVLLGAINTLLFKYTRQGDLCVGTPIAGRMTKAVEPLVGFFINMLAIRCQINGQTSFLDLIQQIKQTTLDAFSNQIVPFEQVVERINIARDPSRSPIFQVSLTFNNTPEQDQIRIGQLTVDQSFTALTTIKAQRDLSFFVEAHADGWEIELVYNSDVFKAASITQLLRHFHQLLQSIIAQPEQGLDQLSMVDQKEKEQLRLHFNDHFLWYPEKQGIIDLFEEQVTKNPNHPALIFNDQEMTYAILNQKAEQLGQYLRQTHQINHGDFVGIHLDRSTWMIIALLGVLKTGAAYVPINVEYPKARKQFMINDAKIKVLILHSGTLFEFMDSDLSLVPLDLQWENVVEVYSATSPIQRSVDALTPAYVMYTSGTTGQPKGIVVHQRNVIKLAYEKGAIAIQASDRVLQWSNFAFDGSIYEIFGSLLNGASLCLITAQEAAQPELLAKVLTSQRISLCFFTTALFNAFVELYPNGLKHLRKLVFGGERASLSHVQKAFKHLGPQKLVNAYGPTETTVFATCYPIDTFPNTEIPIGQALSNTQIYVVSPTGQLAGIGVSGEIWIGGHGVSEGYLDRATLTQQQFINNPFTKQKDRLYKTGDWGRMLANGQVAFIGREDDQVKIRGYRIELKAIESALQRQPEVQQSTVVATNDASGTQRLVAYVVGDEHLDKDQLQTQLKKQIPEYMVPALIIVIPELPLTINGKIDKQALPDPDLSNFLDSSYVAPRNALERELAQIWQELLQIERVGIHDNFFDLGGHSLLATRVVSTIRKNMAMDLPITALFNQTTIADLAQWMAKTQKPTQLPAITVQPRPAQIPLSFAQERLWFIDQLEGSVHYHMPAVFTLRGRLETNRLERAFQQMVNRHEVLRTVFRAPEGEAHQVILPVNQWHFSALPADFDPSNWSGQIEAFINHPFDLTQDHMLRAQLIPKAKEEQLLVLVFHHIASDGWSHSIFVKELLEYYQANAENRPVLLPELPIQYADFAIWQKQYLQGALLETQLGYWEEQLQDLNTLSLPTDFPRPKEQSTRGQSVDFLLDKTIQEQLMVLAKQEEVTLFILLLTVFKVLLYRYSGQEDICVGSPIANRTQKEVDPLIGFFVNSLAIRSDLSGQPAFRDLLAQVKATTLAAYNHQAIPFEKIVDRIEQGRDQSRSPIFQVMFVLQNNPEIPELRLGDLVLTSMPTAYAPAKYDLTLNATETPQGIEMNLAFCSDLFMETTMQQMAQHFQCLLQSVLTHPEQPISQLDVLSDQEQQALIAAARVTNAKTGDAPIPLHLFEQQALQHPDQIAAVDDEQRMTYRVLNQRANQLAYFLQQQGVGAEDLVAVCMERSLHWLIGVLGIAKAGAAYVPIDPNYPAARIDFLVADTQTQWLLCDANNAHSLDQHPLLQHIVLDDNWSGFHQAVPADWSVQLNQNQLAYVIYTSGSTGQPKGVQIEQSALANLIQWHFRRFGIDQNSKATVLAGIGFDASVWEFWPYLAAGATIYLLNNELRLSPEGLLDFYQQQQITHSFQPTALISDFVAVSKNQALSLQYLFTGGDRLPPVDISGCSYCLLNNYGPTESTVVTTSYELQAGDHRRYPLIGEAIDGVQVYLLDAFGQLVPQGLVGEMYIGGKGLSRGYLRRAATTAKAFLPHPFDQTADSKIYKTGDLARQLPNGQLAYLGRSDDQVQIRGHRIELGEIEATLQQLLPTSQCVVLVQLDDQEEKRLVAYLRSQTPLDLNEIKAKLKAQLPVYLLPSAIIPLDQFPLSANGKIDKKQLPLADFSQNSHSNYLAPKRHLEKQLANIWTDLLGVERIGLADNFFDLGGHSLLATRLVSAIRKQLNLEVKVKTIFAYPKLIELANHLQEVQPQRTSTILPFARPSQIPLSFAQERLWMIDQIDGSTHYHLPAVFRIAGKLDLVALESAFQSIVNRHEVLRTVFVETKGQVHQKILAPNQWQLNRAQLPSAQNQKSIDEQLKHLIEQPFDLSKEAKLRAHLLKIDEASFLLVLILHHIAADGWSMPIFSAELMEGYQAIANKQDITQAPLPIQYADFAIWQRQHLQGALLEEQLAYWEVQLQDLQPLE